MWSFICSNVVDLRENMTDNSFLDANKKHTAIPKPFPTRSDESQKNIYQRIQETDWNDERKLKKT